MKHLVRLCFCLTEFSILQQLGQLFSSPNEEADLQSVMAADHHFNQL
jgi:hypothetical protein